MSSNSYLVLARRTRPQSLRELVGQEIAAKTLSSMIERKKVPHAFLFFGTRGTGKTSSARILAKSLCCIQGPTTEPCQICDHCMQITACCHEDVLEIDGASNTGVDQIREIRDSARFFPSSARYKIFIIDEVHMLSTGAFNALLKTLEEPPPQVIFMFATTELSKVPITVRSRCMLIGLQKVAPEVLSKHFARILNEDGIEASEEALKLVAREARGSVRDGLSLLEQVLAFSDGSALSLDAVRQTLGISGSGHALALVEAICQGETSLALGKLQEADALGHDTAALLEEASWFIREALVLQHLDEKRTAVTSASLLGDEQQRLTSATSSLTTAALAEMFKLLSNGSREASRQSNGLTWAEIVVLDCISRKDWLSAGELLSFVAGGSSDAYQNSIASNQSTVRTLEDRTFAKPLEAKQIVPAANDDSPEYLKRLSTVLDEIEKKNIGLASKLRNAFIDAFDEHELRFSRRPENKLFTRMQENDYTLLLQTLHGLGYAKIKIDGLDVIKNSNASPANKQGASTIQDQLIPAAQTIASVQKQENEKAKKELEEKLLQNDAIRSLAGIVTSLEFLPLDE